MNTQFHLFTQNIYSSSNHQLYPAFIAAKYINGKFIECYLDFAHSHHHLWYCRTGTYHINNNIMYAHFKEINQCWTNIPNHHFLNASDAYFYYHNITHHINQQFNSLMSHLTQFVSQYNLNNIHHEQLSLQTTNKQIIHHLGKKFFSIDWTHNPNVLIELSSSPLF